MAERTGSRSRIKVLRSFVFRAAVTAELLLPGCAPVLTPTNPSSEKPQSTEIGRLDPVESEIDKISRALEKFKSLRPDCFVEDVATELKMLSEGKLTHNLREVTGDQAAIEDIRDTRILHLRRRSRVILAQSNTSIDDRALLLSYEYQRLREADLMVANKLPISEVQSELFDLADCDTVKFMSLFSPVRVNRLREGRDIPGLPQEQPVSGPQVRTY